MTENDHLDVVPLPWNAMILAGVVGGVLGWLAGWLASPAVPLASVVHGALAGSGGYLLGSVVLLPWVARPLEQWMAIWPGALLSRLLATGIMAWLLYFRPPSHQPAKTYPTVWVPIAAMRTPRPMVVRRSAPGSRLVISMMLRVLGRLSCPFHGHL